MISVLLLDLWQTLATKRIRVFERIQQEYSLPNDAFSFFKKQLLRMEIDEISENDFWQLLYTEYLIPSTKPKLSWRNIYQEITILNQELLTFAKNYKDRTGGRIAIFSNTDPAAKQFLVDVDILPLFDHMFFSFDEQLLKPDPNFIKLVVDKLSVLPEEILYIDDTQECIEVAQSQGIKGIVYKDFSSFLDESRLYIHS